MIRPASGRKPFAGFSVVTRHCRATPRWRIRVLREAEVRERRAAGDQDLRPHEVDLGGLLGHRVLDLDPRVHLDEREAAARVEQELDRAGVDVADLARDRHAGGADPLAQLGVEVRRRRHLDHLLVAALHRAVALEQVDDRRPPRRPGSAPRCGARRSIACSR